ncbi:hypothetical protein [Caulobacter sp.]|uniref:hypothetical protein n=1 Tax=Caulobacter sp. TaxID=78 RepID=UPI003BAE5B06
MAVMFLDLVRQTRKGAISEALNEALAKVNEAVNVTGKPGSVTLTLTVAPQKGQRVDATNPAVDLKFAIKSKLPIEELPQGIAFLTGDNDLVRNDPDQQQMFRDASDKPGDRRDDNVAYTPPARGAG